MKSKKNRTMKKSKSKRNSRRKTGSKGWITAIDAAQKTLKKTGSITKAKAMLRAQAAKNARKLFGSIQK